MRTSTENVTLDTWTLRVDGQDVTDIELDSTQVSGVRQMVADATGASVSLHLTANNRGVLLTLMAQGCNRERSWFAESEIGDTCRACHAPVFAHRN